MPKILIPLDGSDIHSQVVAAVVARRDWYKVPPEIHLLNVQRPVSRGIGQFINHDELKNLHRDEGMQALSGARTLLEAAGLTPVLHVLLDDRPAQAITQYARELGFDEVYLGMHEHGLLSGILTSSVVSELLARLDIPVTLVS